MSLFADVPDPTPTRVLCWFSCGAPSAVAAKLTLAEYPDAQVVRIVIDTEHEDSDRFAREVSAWLGKPVEGIRGRYANQYEAILSTGFIKSAFGAKCTDELKKKVRGAYQRSSDLHIFGFDAEEGERIEDFRENNPDLWFRAPVAESGLTKSDCKLIIQKAGIELPAMYRLGYANNNCIGCVKGGMGYWNRIRVDFPADFARMAATERRIGATVLRHRKGSNKGERLYLDELDPTAGRFEEDQPGECGPLCQAALAAVGMDQPCDN
jgi:hypothetical protein